MQIVLTETDKGGFASVIGTEVSGTFSVPRETAMEAVRHRWSEHRVANDQALYQWLETLPQGNHDIRIPEGSTHEDRMQYVLADLIAKRGDVIVTCHRCASEVPLDQIVLQEEDLSTEGDAIRMGFAGDLYLCPKEHGLLFVMTKIF